MDLENVGNRNGDLSNEQWAGPKVLVTVLLR